MRVLLGIFLVFGLLTGLSALQTLSVTEAAPRFQIKLASNPTTGYTWVLAKEDNSKYIQLISQSFHAPNYSSKRMGAPGYQIFQFKVKPAAFKRLPNRIQLHLNYVRPWAPNDHPRKVTYTILLP